jgi:hypothetical protein
LRSAQDCAVVVRREQRQEEVDGAVSEHRRASAIRATVVGLCTGLAVGAWMLAPGDSAPTLGQHEPTGAESTVAVTSPAVRPIIGAKRVGAPAVARSRVPVRLRIPAIKVDTRLERLGLEPDGTLSPPTRWSIAGWYTGGPRPGEPGPAVIAGHVDSTSGPAVFYALHELRVGDAVIVTERAGTVLRFVVDDVASVPKTRFPTTLVYGPQPLPVLRLITCTGGFDATQHSYLDNLIVSAHLA